MKILIAEDERITRANIQRKLEKWGHEVFAVENGSLAWETLQREDISIVITDWVMPDVNGLELLRRIRLRNRGHYIYVILLTSKSEKSDIVEGMEAGADDFLSKPFDGNELRARLRAGIRIIDLEQYLAERNQEITSANRRMKQDLCAAAKLQQSLLPDTLPDISNLSFAWAYQPCEELAGDILNVFRLNRDHVGFYVADVSGHGVPAALLAVSINRVLSPASGRSSLLFRAESASGGNGIASPADVASGLNRQFQMANLDRRYFSLIYGLLNIQTLELRYIPAGHPPILRVPEQGDVQPLGGRNLAIGWFSEAEYEEYACSLKSGDRLYLYSDGITESMSPESEQFGTDRLIDFLAANKALPVAETAKQLKDKIGRWCAPLKPRDDLSILAIEIHAQGLR